MIDTSQIKENYTRYHKSNKEFLDKVKKDVKTIKLTNESSKWSDFDIINYVINNYAFYIERIDMNRRMIWFYDYDLNQYNTDNTLLYECISNIEGKLISTSKLESFIKSINKEDYSMQVRSLNDNELALPDHILNIDQLHKIDYSPDIFAQSRIATNYVKHEQSPTELDIFDIIYQTADENDDRYLGLLQVARQLILKQNLDDSIIQFIGPGGHGKSIFGQFLTNMIGDKNVSNITLDQFSNKDELYTLINAHAVIADDIDDGVYINKTKNLKSISSGHSVTISPKYEKSIKINFNGIIIQLAPNIIKMNEQGGQMKRRLKPYSFNRDFTKEQNQINSRELNKIINNKHVQEYFMYHILNDDRLKQSTFIGWDKELLNEATELNDPAIVVGQYIKNETNLLELEKIPVNVIRALYLDILDAEPNSKTAQITTKEVLRKLDQFFKANGYVKSNKKIRPHKFFEQFQFKKESVISMFDHETILNEGDDGYEISRAARMHEGDIDDTSLGYFMDECKNKDNTSSYLTK